MKDGTALLGRHLTLTGLHHTTPTMPRPLRHVLHATPTTPCPSPSPLSLTRGHLCCKLGPLRGPGAQLRHGVVPAGLSSKAASKSDRWCWRAELCSGSPGPWPSLRRPLERWPVSPGPLGDLQPPTARMAGAKEASFTGCSSGAVQLSVTWGWSRLLLSLSPTPGPVVHGKEPDATPA